MKIENNKLKKYIYQKCLTKENYNIYNLVMELSSWGE